MKRYNKSLVWLRRDLRLHDNAALWNALASSQCVYCVFLFDRDILDPLLARGLVADRRVEFIHGSVLELNEALRQLGGQLRVLQGRPAERIPALAAELGVDAVFANRDVEPAAIERDAAVEARLQAQGRHFESFKDQVIFEKHEVLTQGGKPYAVFTPYRNAWLKKLLPDEALPAADIAALNAWLPEPDWHRLAPAQAEQVMPDLQALGFAPANLAQLGIRPGMSGASQLLEDFLPRMAQYRQARDFPAVKGPSYLSVHLRFGTVSIRALVRMALDAMRSFGGEGASTWLSELIWRDFYQMILAAHPHVVDHAFRPEFDKLEWESGDAADALFEA